MRGIFYFETKGSINEHCVDAPLFAVKGFERGYYPIYSHASAAQLNKDVPAEVLEAALLASVCGWNVPGAAPARSYIEQLEAAKVQS